MKLHFQVIAGLAGMVVGDHPAFPYRSSSQITRFFRTCGLPFVHDGTTRPVWARERLLELNEGTSSKRGLPTDSLLTVIGTLLDPYEFDAKDLPIEPALEALNALLRRPGLTVHVDPSGRVGVVNNGTGVDSQEPVSRSRPLTSDEAAKRARLEAFLDSASEDELTERMLVPYFQRLGFQRVSATGHREKILEFGKDLWMKLQLPTGHWIYFCAQIKRDRVDARGAGQGNNVAVLLSQALMAIGHEIFDPDTNRTVLLDHLYLISAGEITKAARTWLAARLDADKRRHIIFMDRAEFLDNAVRILTDLPLGTPVRPSDLLTGDDVPS